ncbi:DUF5036 family protein [Proteiniphilum saccharofermentans]|uniref:DUF5036 family protein n=1 Tax=Proteiniphilum saccharofermentans TaxID=1642647 RepID=UPI0028AE426F|nr:DUF5036 family protein [Proteiniphilum saccharofermentans]
MKTYNLFLSGIILISAITFISCDKNDDFSDPEGTIMLNMSNEENGKILLGNSDVFIDKANNFSTSECLIASLGNKNGLVQAPLLKNLGNKVAVGAGNTYQIFRRNALRTFPSGEHALHIESDYYNVSVVSLIKQDDNITGANVKYVLTEVPQYDLPEYDTSLGEFYPWTDDGELTITLSSSDFEYEPDLASSNYYTLEHEKKGNKLIIRLIDVREPGAPFGFYIRIKGSYTYVYGIVQW